MTIVAETAELAHGFSMRDVERIAGASVRNTRRYVKWMEPSEQYELAWFAIVELIYTTPDKPATLDMIHAGQKAITAEHERYLADHGVDRDTLGPKVNHAKYWAHVAGPTPDFTEAIAERIALPQVLAALTVEQYEVLAAVAASGSNAMAAEALGISLSGLNRHLKEARERIIRLWMEGESPWVLRQIDLDKECKSGHPRSVYLHVDPKSGIRMCRRCLTLNARRRRARTR